MVWQMCLGIFRDAIYVYADLNEFEWKAVQVLWKGVQWKSYSLAPFIRDTNCTLGANLVFRTYARYYFGAYV